MGNSSKRTLISHGEEISNVRQEVTPRERISQERKSSKGRDKKRVHHSYFTKLYKMALEIMAEGSKMVLNECISLNSCPCVMPSP